jgi:hypothetical protein
MMLEPVIARGKVCWRFRKTAEARALEYPAVAWRRCCLCATVCDGRTKPPVPVRAAESGSSGKSASKRSKRLAAPTTKWASGRAPKVKARAVDPGGLAKRKRRSAQTPQLRNGPNFEVPDEEPLTPLANEAEAQRGLGGPKSGKIIMISTEIAGSAPARAEGLAGGEARS